MSPRRLLVIGPDDPLPGLPISSLLLSAGPFSVEKVQWRDLVNERVLHSQAHLILALAIPTLSEAMQFFTWLRTHPLSKPTLAILPGDAEDDALRTTAEAVDDFLLWPTQPREFAFRLSRILGPPPADIESLRSRLSLEFGMAQIAGENDGFLQAIGRIPLMAAADVPVLITGETGVGKELCARAIHHLSARRAGPFIPMDCGALPEGLMENELFGHSRGAFTGAHTKQKGLVAMAQGGTLFLDEVDSLSLAAQSKLLRLLQEQTYRPLGAEQFCQSNARVIAATNRNLEEYLREGKFRQDLYYRLDVLHLRLPSLRERTNDIALLARRYLWSLPGDQHQPRKRLSASAIRKLENHDWPGNVRELFNVLQRAAVFSAKMEIGPDDIILPQTQGETGDACKTFRNARALAIERFERAYVVEILRRHGGNITRAALEAGKDRRAFGRLVSKYQIDRRHPA